MTDISQVKRAIREGDNKELQIIRLKDIRDKIQCLLNAIENDAPNLNEYNVTESAIILKDMLYHKWGLPSQIIKELLKDFGYKEMWVMEAIYAGMRETSAEFFLTDEELENWLTKGGWSFGKEENGYFAEKENSRVYHITKQWISLDYSSRY